MLKDIFIHSTKHILNTYHVPATGNTNMKDFPSSQAAHFNRVIRQVKRQLQHRKFCNTDVAIGYCRNTYKKHQMLTEGKEMGTKWGHEPYLKRQAKVSQIIKVAKEREYSRQKENIYKGTKVSKCAVLEQLQGLWWH